MTTHGSGQNAKSLVADLASKDVSLRHAARTSLVKLGVAATPSLLQGLDAPQQHARWEAAKALAEIRDPVAAERLVTALEDKDPDVRWVVGEALIALQAAAVRPLLGALTQSPPHEGLYQGAHHVLHHLAGHGELTDVLTSVVTALNQAEPEMAVPLAAAKTLKAWAN